MGNGSRSPSNELRKLRATDDADDADDDAAAAATRFGLGITPAATENTDSEETVGVVGNDAIDNKDEEDEADDEDDDEDEDELTPSPCDEPRPAPTIGDEPATGTVTSADGSVTLFGCTLLRSIDSAKDNGEVPTI